MRNNETWQREGDNRAAYVPSFIDPQNVICTSPRLRELTPVDMWRAFVSLLNASV